jgi:SnoaL-like domain
MDEASFRAYIAEFNAANFAALARYYADDVVFSFNGGLTLNGRDAIIDFYRPFREAVDEAVEIRFLVMDDKHVAVEMATEFTAREDYQNFTRGPLKAGDTLRITSFVHYDIGPDGRFTNIRVGRYGDA